MFLKRHFLLGVFFLSLVFGANVGEAAEFSLDPNYSTVGFRIRHLMGFAVGSFTKFDGMIQLNQDNTVLVSLEGTIDAQKIDTRLPERDNDLRSARFFDVEKYPVITFRSTKIEPDKITGTLTMHGVTKEIVFDYVFLGLAKDQKGNTKTAVSMYGKVNRKDFGMDYNMKTESDTWLLGDEVEFKLELHGTMK